jgi:hypothetical protein
MSPKASHDSERDAAGAPSELYGQWKKRRDAFFRELQAMAEEANVAEEEAERLVQEAIAAGRAAPKNQ